MLSRTDESAGAAGAAGEGTEPEVDEHAVTLELESEGARQVEAHREEARDPNWARFAESTITKNIGEFVGTTAARSGAQLLSVDCRTSSCIATLEWPSYKLALQSHRRLVTMDYGMRCGTWMHLDEPRDPSAQYHADLILDCTDERARAE